MNSESGPSASQTALFVGDFRVTALADGLLDVPVAAYQCADHAVDVEDVERRVLASHDIAVDGSANFLIPSYAFLIRGRGRNVLVDAGTGGLLPPVAENGFVIAALQEAGLTPSDIDDVVMTHLHPDHVGGLTTHSGEKRFPNARLHVSTQEWEYWQDDRARAKVPDFVQGLFDGARSAVAPYEANLHLFPSLRHEVLPGISAMPLPGHTPGHTGYLVESGDAVKLLIWGDIVHSEFLEFQHPDWSMTFDVDAAQAVRTRREAMGWAAKEQFLVAGMHLTSPAMGQVSVSKDAFEFVSLVR